MCNVGMLTNPYHIAGKFGGGKFGELASFDHLAKESLAD